LSRGSFDAVALKSVLIAIEMDRPQVEHRLGPGDTPVHAGSFHPVLDHMPAGALNRPAAATADHEIIGLYGFGLIRARVLSS